MCVHQKFFHCTWLLWFHELPSISPSVVQRPPPLKLKNARWYSAVGFENCSANQLRNCCSSARCW